MVFQRNTAETAQAFVKRTVTENRIVLFMKGTPQIPQCGFSGQAMKILRACGAKNVITVNVLDDDDVRQAVKAYGNWPTIPQLYVAGELIGGSDILKELEATGDLGVLLAEPS